MLDKILKDLDKAWEVLAKPSQTVMRRYGIKNPYEQLKALTRGQAIDAQTVAKFIKSLNIPDSAKQALSELTPENYTGNAKKLAQEIEKLI